MVLGSINILPHQTYNDRTLLWPFGYCCVLDGFGKMRCPKNRHHHPFFERDTSVVLFSTFCLPLDLLSKSIIHTAKALVPWAWHQNVGPSCTAVRFQKHKGRGEGGGGQQGVFGTALVCLLSISSSVGHCWVEREPINRARVPILLPLRVCNENLSSCSCTRYPFSLYLKIGCGIAAPNTYSSSRIHPMRQAIPHTQVPSLFLNERQTASTATCQQSTIVDGLDIHGVIAPTLVSQSSSFTRSRRRSPPSDSLIPPPRVPAP